MRFVRNRPRSGGEMRLSVGFLTDRGLHPGRPVNEDSLYVPRDLDPDVASRRGLLYAVSDGMGGEAAGEVASRLGVDTLAGFYYREPWAGDPARMLEQAARAANDAVSQAAEQPDKKGMGATLVAVVMAPGRAFVLNIGDSRCYRVRDGRIEQVTDDHTVVARMVRRGLMTPEEARTSPKRNIISQYLGKGDLRPDLFEHELRSGDIFLLMSDGVHGVLADEELRVIALKLPPEAAAGEIVEQVKQRGAPDNATVIVVRCEEAGERGERGTRNAERGMRKTSAGRSPGRLRRLIFAVWVVLVLAALIFVALRLDQVRRRRATKPAPADSIAVPDSAAGGRSGRALPDDGQGAGARRSAAATVVADSAAGQGTVGASRSVAESLAERVYRMVTGDSLTPAATPRTAPAGTHPSNKDSAQSAADTSKRAEKSTKDKGQ